MTKPGCFRYQENPVMKKILIGAGIFALISAAIFFYFRPITAIANFKYDESQFKKDTQNGLVSIIIPGLPSNESVDEATISRRYGFIYEYAGCVVPHDHLNDIRKYNELASDWLDERNGKDWQKRYADDLNKAALSEQLVPVMLKGGCGFMDQEGKMVIDTIFDHADLFSEGMALVASKDFKYGFIDQEGRYVVQPQFKDARSFSEGMASVMRRDLSLAFINAKGEVVIELPANIDEAGSFKEGRALVRTNNKYGFIDPTGTVVIPCQFDLAEDFSEGLARVGIITNGKEKFGFIRTDGSFFIEPQSSIYHNFSGGLAAVKTGSKYGFIGRNGEMKIKARFDEVGHFKNGYCAAKSGDLWGFINNAGDWAIEPKFKLAKSFARNGLAAVYSTGGKWGFVNQSGELVIPHQFESVRDFVGNTGFGLINVGGSYIRINTEGEQFHDSEFISANSFYKKYLNLDKKIWQD